MVTRHPRVGLLIVSVVFVSTWPASAMGSDDPPVSIATFFSPPAGLRGNLGSYRSPLTFADGRITRTPGEWVERRREILASWHGMMGKWPPLIAPPEIEDLGSTHEGGFTRRKARFQVAPDRKSDGYFLVPDGPGPFPAMLIVFYEPETAIGRGKPHLDFGDALVRRGFAVLSIGFDPRVIDVEKSGLNLQPLSYLAYVASNCFNALADLPRVDPKRIGVMGHSYGGKWAMFAACLDDRFACGVWSDPGIAFDEARSNVNYWEPWYLGWEPGKSRKPGLLSDENPRMGAYKRLVESGHDLHELQSLMAPRPFLVSGGSEDPPERWKVLNHVVAVNTLLGQSNRVAMTNREGHTPTEHSNEQIYRFLEYTLKPAKR